MWKMIKQWFFSTDPYAEVRQLIASTSRTDPSFSQELAAAMAYHQNRID